MNTVGVSSKTAVRSAIVGGKIATIFGWIIAVIFLLGIIGSFSENGEGSGDRIGAFIFCTLAEILGIYLIYYGYKVKNRIRRFRQYINIITNENLISVDEIANGANKPVEFVYRDIQKMISANYFVGASIDPQTRNILFGRRAEIGTPESQQSETAPNAYAGPKMITVVCQSCGAKNRVEEGNAGECEYCGSPILK